MRSLQQWALFYKKTLFFLVILSLLLSISIILQGYSIVKIVDLVFIQKAIFTDTLPYFYMLAGAIFIRLLMNFMLGKTGGNLAEKVKNTIRSQLLEKWTKSPIETQITSQTGSKVTLLVDTVDQLESYYREYIPQVIKTLIVPAVVLVTVFIAHPLSGWIMLVTAPFIPITYIIIGIQTQAKSEEQLTAMNRFSGTFLDLLQGLQTLRLFGQSKKQQQVLATSNKGFMDATLSVLKIAFASTLFIELITTLGVGLIALEIGFRMIVFQTLTFAPAFFVLTLAPEYYNSLKELGAAFHTGRGSLGAAAIIDEALQKEITPVTWGKEKMAKKPSLQLEDATYAYEDGPVIGPISITAESGQTVAIIGPTGHGKSTTLNMLSSMVELVSGNILINGIPRAHIDEATYTKQMSYISQHPYVFAGTLRDNIRMGQDTSDEMIIASIVKAQLSDWFEALPDGLDTQIGEGGRGLSGGEKQRVAIARAFVKQPSIVFFDEPTAGLDVSTEKLLTAAIRKLSEDATVVIVAHRFESIQHADKLYILEDGQIIASGTHETLATHPFYAQTKQGGFVNE